MRFKTFKEMKALAISRNGSCLSKHSDENNKLTWKCEKGHRWIARADHVKRGSWCPICAQLKNAEKRRLNINDMNELAIQRGGKCISTHYVNNSTKLVWECSEGHQWEAMPYNIKSGKWCSRCAGVSRGNIEEIKNIAISRGGKCLSLKYKNRKEKLHFRCGEGHFWKANADSIVRGSWCSICAAKHKGQQKAFDIEFAKELATKRGGKCLSKKYINQNHKLKWQCQCGFIWEAKTSNIVQGNWCPKCAGKALTIEDMRALAKKRGGRCLSNKYRNAKAKLDWVCYLGHKFRMTYDVVKRGGWCLTCSEGIGERICRIYFEQIFDKHFPKSYPSWLRSAEGYQLELDGYCQELNIAFEHHGRQHYNIQNRFITDEDSLNRRKYLDSQKVKLCRRNGVSLIVIPEVPSLLRLDALRDYIRGNLKKQRIKIPESFEKIEVDLYRAYIPAENDYLNDIKEIAVSKGGKCLSDVYLGNKSKLEFECPKGHRWRSVPTSIKNGTWCPTCSRKMQSIADLQKYAITKNGKCLSKAYKNLESKLQWQCEKRHVWKASFRRIKTGSWCPTCQTEVKSLNTIKELSIIAKEKHGNLISMLYKNNTTKMLWECKHSHKWKSTPKAIKRGTWCPLCSNSKI